MDTNKLISLRILAHINDGLDVKQAIDAVLGAGTSGKLIDDLYVALRAKAGAA